MRVVMAANWWYRRGGLGGVMLDEAVALEQRGHTVVPFAAAHPDNLETAWSGYFPPFVETGDGGRALAPATRLAAALRLIHNGTAADAFARLLEEVQPDVVHVHNPSRQLSPSVVGEARRRGIPVVITLHDFALICPQGNMYKAGRRPCTPPNCVRGNVIHAVLNRCVQDSVAASAVAATEHLVHRAFGSYTRRVARFIAPSRFVADAIIEAGLPRRRTVVLANALDPGPEPQPIPDAGGHVLYTGRLAREKGLRDLIAAAGTLPDVPFTIAGDGPLRQSLVASAPPNVTFLGHVDQASLDELRTSVVAVVSPSTWYENAPLAVLEAMRAGRPVVATAIGGQPELLASGGGILVEPGDIAALSATISRLWMDREQASELGRAGRAALVAQYGLDQHIDRLLELYRDVTRLN
ncbi:MAG TPA: glycosyltransferase [Candidatus Limnocylindrales bacterium]|jgi:glycosyltransferase involved in cell wall biosynthesis